MASNLLTRKFHTFHWTATSQWHFFTWKTPENDPIMCKLHCTNNQDGVIYNWLTRRSGPPPFRWHVIGAITVYSIFTLMLSHPKQVSIRTMYSSWHFSDEHNNRIVTSSYQIGLAMGGNFNTKSTWVWNWDGYKCFRYEIWGCKWCQNDKGGLA